MQSMKETTKSDIAPATLARTGLAISLVGFGTVLSVAAYAYLMQATKIEVGPVGLEGNILPPGSVSFVSILFSGILMLCALVAGLTLSGIGFVVSLISLGGRETQTSLLGVLFGATCPALLLLAYFILILR
jgi:hypothetical protein